MEHEKIIGKKFNMLLCKEYAGKLDGRRRYYIFKCDCGKLVTLKGTIVKTEKQKSCGCLRKAKKSKFRKQHQRTSYFEKLLSRTNKTPTCWLYTGHKDSNGYGIIGDKNKSLRAHRVSYIYYNNIDNIPNGMFVCHTCDNPSCINPNHLFLGTPNDNVQDMMEKGRHVRGGKIHKGEKNGMAKLKEKDVLFIYSQKGKITQRDLAYTYGVSISTIQKITRKKLWKHLHNRPS